MKSTIKRCLFAGFAMTLVALTARRFEREEEIEGSLDQGRTGKSGLPPTQGDNQHLGSLPGVSGGSGAQHGPLPHSPNVSVTFSGTVVRNGAGLALREVAGALYPLAGASSARSFEGASVRVTGKINLATRLLHVEAIEPAVLQV
jgi:hypothetical protein